MVFPFVRSLGRDSIVTMSILLKTIHTIVWAIMTFANFFAFYLAFIGRFDIWFWIPASFIMLEIFIIVLNDWKCPMTGMIEKYTKDRSDNFGLYIPGWLAKYNVRIYTILIPLEVLIVLIKHYFY